MFSWWRRGYAGEDAPPRSAKAELQRMIADYQARFNRKPGRLNVEPEILERLLDEMPAVQMLQDAPLNRALGAPQIMFCGVEICPK